MRRKNWTITPDGMQADFVAYHDNFDPTPVNPDEPLGDPDHVLYGDTVDALIMLIDKLEVTA